MDQRLPGADVPPRRRRSPWRILISGVSTAASGDRGRDGGGGRPPQRHRLGAGDRALAGLLVGSALTEPNIVWVACSTGSSARWPRSAPTTTSCSGCSRWRRGGESQRTLALTPIGTLVTLLIYLGLGAGLFTFYTQHPAPALVSRPDEILPHFVEQVMPPVLRGLMLAPSCWRPIDSPLGSLAASFVTDIYRPLLVRTGPSGTTCACRALGGARLRRRAGRAGLGFRLRAGPDPVAVLQDRRGDFGLAARGVPARAPEPRARWATSPTSSRWSPWPA